MRRTTTTLAALLAALVLGGLLGGTAMAALPDELGLGVPAAAAGASQAEIDVAGEGEAPRTGFGGGEQHDSDLPAGAIVGIVFSIIIGALVLVLSLGYILPKPPGR